MGDYIIVGILYVALAAMAVKVYFNRKQNGREWTTKNMRPVQRHER